MKPVRRFLFVPFILAIGCNAITGVTPGELESKKGTTSSASCAGSGESCSLAQPCCGGTCVSDSLCHDECTENASCSTGCCAPLVDGSGAVCADAKYCSGHGIGDACVENANCLSNGCLKGKSLVGWCTKPCSGGDCAGNSNGASNQFGSPNYCIENTSHADYCFPGCSSDADCKAFPGTSCKAVTSVGQGNVGVCSA